MYFAILCTFVFSSVIVLCENTEVVEFRNLMKELKDEMAELRKVRLEDSETIRRLQDNVHPHGKSDQVTEEGALLGSFNERNVPRVEDLSRKPADAPWTNGIPLFGSQRTPDVVVDVTQSKVISKTEVDYLRQELSQLRKQISDMSRQHTKPTEGSSSVVAVRWLQRAVAELRREMREMAVSMNTSAALAEKQQTKTHFALLTSDVAALGHRVDRVRVDRERNTALIQQLRLDGDEMRQRLQESAIGQQKLLIEVETLKEELKEQVVLSNAKKLFSESSTESTEQESQVHSAGRKEHLRFRHDRWKKEVNHLQEAVNNLHLTQTDLTKRLQVLTNHQASQALKIQTLEKHLNRNVHQNAEQTLTNQRLNVLESLVNQTESQTLEMQTSINNITTTGIQKLHGSTVQLFKALERLESSYDQSTDDLRKEISKLDSNLSQTQSRLEELRGSGASSSLKLDGKARQSDALNSRYLSLSPTPIDATFNGTHSMSETVVRRLDAKVAEMEFQIQSLSADIDAEKVDVKDWHRLLASKADKMKIRQIDSEQRKVRESLLQFKEDIPQIRHHQDEMEQELEMFSSQLPRDCSGNSSLEATFNKKNGLLLIRHPVSISKFVTVFCDMETAGGQWTLIQRRSKGDQSFNADWKNYKDGFGDVSSGDFWLGNEFLHQATANEDYTLRIDMWDIQGRYMYAEYGTFRVLSEADNYRLVISDYRGNASDAMSYHNGMAFSAPDRDNDASSATHCADFYGSGWWYNHCQYVNINGRFNTGMTWYNINGQEWTELARVEMKIRPQSVSSF